MTLSYGCTPSTSSTIERFVAQPVSQAPAQKEEVRYDTDGLPYTRQKFVDEYDGIDEWGWDAI